MEQKLLVREEILQQASDFIGQAFREIYQSHPHEMKTTLFIVASLIFGYGAYQEYGMVKRTDNGKVA